MKNSHKKDTAAFGKWTLANKHLLRSAYADFLELINVTPVQFLAGECKTYADFQRDIWSQRKNHKEAK